MLITAPTTFGLSIIMCVLIHPGNAGGKGTLFSTLDLRSGDTLRYTVDGSTPGRSSPFVVYGNNTLYVAGTTTFRVRLYRPGFLPSEVQTATVSVAGTNYYVYPDYWNLVSLPLTVNNRTRSVVFRSAVGDAYAYNFATGYARKDTLQYGVGYLLRFNGQQVVPISGGQRTIDTATVQPEWNIVGSISIPVPVTAIQQIPSGIIQSSFYAYSGGYVVVDTLTPGKGYWVKARAAGILILSTALPSLKKETPDLSLVAHEAAAITVSDMSGAKQTLCFSSEPVEKRRLNFFELPPPPPAGIFDARFVTNRMLETVQKGEVREIPIRVSFEQYPLSISWQMKGQTLAASLVIGSKELSITGDGSTTISERPALIVLKVAGQSLLPKEFMLLQNYPNPFNPSTTFKYDLPKDSRVTLKIFDILGQEIVTLVNEEQKAGYRSVEWNANNFASGVYFCRFDAGGFSSVKKLLLLR